MSRPYTDLPPNHPLGSSGDDENLSVVIEGYPDDNTPFSDTPSGQHADLGEPSVSRNYSLGRTPLQETGIRETNIDDDLDDDNDASDTQRLIPHDDDYDSGVEDVVIFDKRCESLNVNTLVQTFKGDESSMSIMMQVTIPFIIAGYGTVGAGMVLDVVQHWDVFVKVGEIFILVPALLGLKGNLEMTLASRLSTQANLGNMDTRKEVLKMVGGNLALVQAQAIVVGFLASLTAMIMGWIPEGKWNMEHGLLLCASSLFTASIASLILGLVMVLVIILSRKVNVNPDNVATPIAASLGDLVTLSILSWVANMLFEAIGKEHWIAPSIIVFFLCLLPLWVYICYKNPYTHEVIQNGWTPVLAAMFISSIGGLILDFTVANYNGIAVFQPVINGVGGNLVAVHASRLSTLLHQKGKPGSHGPCKKLLGCLNPMVAFFGKGVYSRAARVLILLTIPGHLLFMYTIYYMKAGHTSMSLTFQMFYLIAALTQVIILLYIATWMVPLIWVKGADPDNAAIPYLTAIGDLLGTAFLAIAFHLLYLMGDRDADVGD